jgi:hypothetical protein
MSRVASSPTVLKSCNFTNPHVFVTRLVAVQNEYGCTTEVTPLIIACQLYIMQILQ